MSSLGLEKNVQHISWLFQALATMKKKKNPDIISELFPLGQFQLVAYCSVDKSSA